MAMMECRSCHRIADSRGFQRCGDCGAPLCDDCANESDNRCPDCGARDYLPAGIPRRQALF